MTKKAIWKESEEMTGMTGEQVVEVLDNFCKLTGKTRGEVSLDREYGEDYCYVTFGTFATETDEEYKARLVREETLKKAAEKYRCSQYEILKKEFGE